MKMRVFAVAAALAASATSAFATEQNVGQREGFYAFGGIGRSHTSEAIRYSSGHTSIPENRGAWQLGGGYRVNPYLGIEAAYRSGRAKHWKPYDGYVGANSVSGSVVGFLPVGPRLELFASGGIARVESKYGELVPKKKTSTQLVAGVGANVHLTNHLALRAELDQVSRESHGRRTQDTAKRTNENAIVTVGVAYSF